MITPQAPTAPDLALVRQRRDRTGTSRLYVADILIGCLDHVRTRGATGRRCTRWQPTPSAAAWTMHRIGAPGPDRALLAPLPAVHTSRDDAARALLDHLRAAGAPAVDAAYGLSS